MKKTLRILTITAVAAAVVLIAACKQFLADPEEFFSYWAAEVIGTDYSIDKPQQMNKDGIPCVPSADDVTVTITLRNPKSFRLVMPTAPSDAGNVIIFPGLSPQPVYGTDYRLGQPAPDKLALTYKPAFLKAHEWSNGDISPEITFTADDGRKFSKKFSMNLKVNTAPALEYAGICKTATADSDGNHFYVLLFRVKDMDNPITAGSIHKDIKKLIVTAGGGSPVEIPLSLNTGDTDFPTGGDLLATVHALDIDHPLPGGNWLLRLKTDVKVGGPEKVYEVCIKDEQGLSSAVIRASTQKNKLPDVELFDGSNPIPEPAPSLAGAEAARPKNFPGINGKTLTAQAPAGAAITGSIAKRNSDGTWTQISGGTVSGTTTAAVNLPALAAGETVVLYKITLKASLTGYDDSDPKDFFVRLIWQEIPVLKLKQNFSSGDNNLHSISAGTKAYVTEDIIPDAGYYNNNANALVIYNDNPSSPAVKLELSASAGSTVKYELDSGAEQSAPAPAEITVTGGTHKLEVWAESSGIPGPFTTVYINVVNSVSNYTQLKNVVQNAPVHSSAITINIASNFTAPADIGNTEIAVTDGKKLIIQSDTSGNPRTINAGGFGRIFNISGSGTVLNLEDIKLEGGNASTGGAVYVEDGGILKLTGETVITPSTGADINTPGKNDVYLANGTSIKVDSTLTTTEPIVARITPQTYSDGHTVLTGTQLSAGSPTNYTRFNVTQRDDGFLWTIKSDGTLKKISTTINGGSGAWKRLKDAVQNLPEGSTITVDGLIQATNDAGNNGEIVINKNLTVKGKNGAGTDILDANSSGTNAPATTHRIFKVEAGKKLTLENLTLKNGKVTGTDDQGCGGAIYVKGATVNMTNCTLTGNQATKDGGAVFATKDNGGTASTVTINGGSIGSNTVILEWACGGGIFVAEGSTLTLDEYTDGSGTKHGVQITGNKAGRGGGVRANDSTVTMTGCTITDNQATGDSGGGGVYICGETLTMERCTLTGNTTLDRKPGGGLNIEKGEVTMTNCTLTGNIAGSSGGGIYTKCIDDIPSTVTIKGCTIKNNSASRNDGGGIYIGDRCTVTLEDNGTTGCTVKGNWAGYNGKGVFVEKPTATFTMKGGTKIDQDNDVFLRADSSGSAKITVDSSLSPAGGIAARITPEQYTAGTQVLAAGAGVTLASETYKFAVTPQTSPAPQEWTVGGNGRLKQGRYTEVPYNQLETYLANASSTEVNYIEVTGISAGDLKGTAGSSSNPANPGPLGQKIKSIYPKKVALKLPDGLYVTDMSTCFALCKNLISVENIPSGVTDMQACFYGCENLTTVPAIPATVRGMLECFRFCKSLTTAPNIPSGVNSMAYCFDGCTSLTTAPNIPSGVNSMAYCFNGCTSLTTVPNIPATVTSMAYCFNGCKSLTQCPDIPSSVTDMRYCFGNCTVLKRVKINRGYAGCDFYNTFKDCTSLQDGGIQVLSTELTNYQNAADFMGTTAAKFSAQ